MTFTRIISQRTVRIPLQIIVLNRTRGHSPPTNHCAPSNAKMVHPLHPNSHPDVLIDSQLAICSFHAVQFDDCSKNISSCSRSRARLADGAQAEFRNSSLSLNVSTTVTICASGSQNACLPLTLLLSNLIITVTRTRCFARIVSRCIIASASENTNRDVD